MERRSWLWRRKSSEKSPGETESSGSVSSGRFSDEQEASRASPIHTRSPEVSSNLAGSEVQDTVKSLTEKLSAALSNISAKDALVKQHAKVAEEAVSGWEKAENEVVALKQQLEAASQKNLALEDRVGHLDGALKECVRQLRQAREEQEQKIHEAIVKKTQEWESAKFELESQLAELHTHPDTAKAEAAASADHDLRPKLDAAEKENSALKLELLARAEELEIRTLERELSTQAAETASKQHLESIKKVAKLEAECRKLRATARKSSSPANSDHKHVAASSLYVESLTDSQSDSGERFLAVDADTRKMGRLESSECEVSCSDSWASALISELNQFKNKKAINKSLTSASIDIDLMDDFLEMEKLAAMPEINNGSHGSDFGAVRDQDDSGDNPFKAELQAMIQRTAELEEKLEKMENEKVGLEMALAESQDQLKLSLSQLMESEEKLLELERELATSNELKQAAETEVEATNAKRKVAESLLEAVDSEVRVLREKVASLEVQVEKERALSLEIAAKCRSLEDELSRKKREAELRRATSSSGELKIKQEKELAVAAGKLAECQKTIASLGLQLKSLATLEEFLMDSDMPELNGGSPFLRNGAELRLHSNDSSNAKKEVNSSKTSDGSGLSPNSIADKGSPPSASSSSSANQASERSRNGLGKLFSRSKSSSSHTENQ
ncbi:filament-like plant protein isoform X1 [Cinnamomum micranthum f. kanehirae]|uniref:Filament-like plant protein isoform X1 n=1 Tax=Cinnamomum micranthum f. kanehirae TaxID=337451 RepID=A0A3S3QJN3_9MAGN|nr:filament-like plant protein isoform X1 [Cinnamomum micranthum f. kanehirae]